MFVGFRGRTLNKPFVLFDTLSSLHSAKNQLALLLYKKACCQSSWCSFLLLQQLLEVVWGGGVSGTYSGTFCSLCNHTRNDRYITQMVKYSFFEEDAILTRTALLSSSRHIFPIFRISFVDIWTPIQQKHTTTSASGAKPQPLS